MPYTSFQTPTEYLPENDIRTDAVIVYSDARERIRSWGERGYIVQTMYGFRTGPDYVKDHPDEVQTTADGTLLTCGPGSYYMVPTSRRIRAAIDYFTNAIKNGTTAVIPEEPEFFAVAGYSESFKRAWQDYYGEPWQDPASSVEARWKSERLKAQMEYDIVKAIMDAAEKQDPNVRRMVACHSAVNYYAWGIVYPHYQCFSIPNLQEIIGQVWTGTARSACRYEGVVAERTFENAFLEYSSLYNLVRGSNKRLWFLMDPLEDNPNRTMGDYRENYHKTLVASLMFPDVDAYEVMPWPTRIYGRVPKEYKTEIGSVINALQDMHNQKRVYLDMGTRGIATFVADSMGWQRGAPYASNYDCFYGITLPLVYRGIPIQVAQLERSPEKGYLDAYKVILMSYDIMKPTSPNYNQAITSWVKKGGVLVFFGGTDAYNSLREWWTRAGFVSPQEELYTRLGVDGKLVSRTRSEPEWTELARETKRYRQLENRKIYRFDLTPFAESGKPIYVRFRDAFEDDGWGPAVFRFVLTVGDERWEVPVGTDGEKFFLSNDSDSIFNGRLRFADGLASWAYRFQVPKGSSPILEVDMGNQFVVEAASGDVPQEWELVSSVDKSPFLGEHSTQIRVPTRFPLTVHSTEQFGIYHEQGRHAAVIFERRVGKGWLIHVGIAPSYFASSREGADLLRGITSYACEKAGIRYRECPYFAIHRGPYVAVRTFECEKKLKGYYVDILDPKLPVVKNPVVPRQRCAFYCDVTTQMSGIPRLLYSSSRIEEKIETPAYARLKLTGPAGTMGVVRIAKNGRRVAEVLPSGQTLIDDNESLCVGYVNNPRQLTLEIKWR
ncbi:MAG: hypothetical protein ACUVRS_06975 [Armatimonadota bacterium]